LVPTKELAYQLTQVLTEICVYCPKELTFTNLSQGETDGLSGQKSLLASLPTILISTPSKLLAHLKAGNLDLKVSLESLVLDEADLMLSFGYEEDVKEVLNYFPRTVQSFLMSATLSPVSFLIVNIFNFFVII
jgi:ATP-dependent RNA helicase DDX56/DBP9